MTRLSACYFCGTALDEPLADYPVVPADRRNDDDVETVTLCPGCHRKLEAVLEVAVDSFAADDATLDPDAAEPFTADADDSLADLDDATGPDASDRSDDTASIDEADEPTERLDASDRADPTPPGDERPSSEDAPASNPDEGSTDDVDATEQSVVEGRHSISALEYNKVMRLLQNREFPVDREEIEVVAANAYQIGRADCANVIDVAIDRGLIEEVDGQLRKPENA